MDDIRIRELYQQLLAAWNRQDARGMASLFVDDASVVGFDGSQMDGKAAIEAELGRIFADHRTAAYVAKVRKVRFLSGDVAVLRAVVGMVPPGGSDINPATNAIQSLVALRDGDQWRLTLFQNTPAQFHGRPELSDALTKELRAELAKRS